MDEVVFLSVLSDSSDFVRNSACYDLWRYQSDCLGLAEKLTHIVEKIPIRRVDSQVECQ